MGRIQRQVLAELEMHGGKMTALDLVAKITDDPTPAAVESVRRAIRELTRSGHIKSGVQFQHGDWSDLNNPRPGRRMLTCWLPVEQEPKPDVEPGPLVWP